MSLPSQPGMLGTLIVVVLKARNLNDKHSFYKQDVFAQVSLNGDSKRTPTDIKGGQHPEWDAEIRFPIMKDGGDKHRKLEVACFAKEHKLDDLLGSGSIDISETLRTGEFDDWVGLETNGVSRGDVYLEMTYYASTPAPSNTGLLSAPINSGLNRRPSKLSPSDRLSRPAQLVKNNVGHNQSFQAQRPYHRDSENSGAAASTLLHPSSLPSSRSSSAGSAKAQNSTLPPLPEGTSSSIPPPNVLLPGGGLRAKPPVGANQSPQPVPSILRPGNAKPSPAPVLQFESNRPSYSSPMRHSQGALPGHPHVSAPSTYGSSQAPATQTLSGYSPAVNNSGVSYYGPHTVSAAVPRISEEDVPSTFSFPVPAVPAVSEAFDYSATNYRKAPAISATHQQMDTSNSFPDPYLQARYQSPLPLPPRSSSPPRGRQSFAHQSSPAPDADRLRAVRLAEEQAAQRKAQEDKDLELALQLDKELNVANEQPSSTQANQSTSRSGMPGGWGER